MAMKWQQGSLSDQHSIPYQNQETEYVENQINYCHEFSSPKKHNFHNRREMPSAVYEFRNK